MSRPVLNPRPIGGLLLFLGSLATVSLTTTQRTVYAQPVAQRVVQGKVVDKSDTGIKDAVVYLKDDHTLSVKSYISAADGSYRFGQLAQNTDYEIWAESAGKKSATKTISSFDTKATVNFTLKIDK